MEYSKPIFYFSPHGIEARLIIKMRGYPGHVSVSHSTASQVG